MIKIIKSIIASNYYMNAMTYSANYERAQAYGYISRAIALESSHKIIPKYLVLKAKIEIQMGYIDDAGATLNRAKGIIEDHPSYWSKGSRISVVVEIDKLIEEIDSGNWVKGRANTSIT